MRFLLKMLLSAVAVFVLASVLPGVGVDSYVSALIVAVVLSVLNTIVKPILIFFTFPVTVITLGLFLLVINIIIIKMGDYFVGGFSVDGWLWALIFSVLLSLLQSILHSVLEKDKK